MEKPKKLLPRHFGGTLKLKGGTGPILHMIGMNDYLEVFKPDWTFRLQTPENIDPEQTLEDVPWVVQEIPNVGSSNPIVARVFIQTNSALKNKRLKGKINASRIIAAMHACKEELLTCDSIYKRLKPEHDAIIEKIERGELERDGKVLNPFPRLASLEDSASQFLICVKKAIQRVADVFCEFYPTAVVKNGRFDHAIKFLETNRPDYSQYLTFLREEHPNIVALLDMRNFQEHPGDGGKTTTIFNFRLTPTGIRRPSWFVTGKPESGVLTDMPIIIEFLVQFAELNVLFCLMDNLDGATPYRVDEIQAHKRDPNCPIRFSVEFAFLPPRKPDS
jgi:hypothetical protein